MTANPGTHVAFLEGVAELEYIRRKTIEDGRLFRDYQDRVTDRQFDQEIALAEEEYMVRGEKRTLRAQARNWGVILMGAYYYIEREERCTRETVCDT